MKKAKEIYNESSKVKENGDSEPTLPAISSVSYSALII